MFLKKNTWVQLKKSINQFYNRSRDNEEKPVVAEKFIETLKNGIHKYMTPVSKKCVYCDVRWNGL